MILEGIVTTRNEDGSLNVAPMGPLVTPDMDTFVLKPFRDATTYANLARERCGVLHVTDDALLFTRAVLHLPLDRYPIRSAERIPCERLSEACRTFEFEVDSVDASRDRAVIQCATVHRTDERPFFGFSRARHAIIEAAILASRIDILPLDEIREQFQQLRVIVNKTGGLAEEEAIQLLEDFFRSHSSRSIPTQP